MPVDRGVIDGQLREIGEGERWWEQREFRDLPYVLQPDERLQGLVNGKLVKWRRPRVVLARTWLIVATTQRLIFLRMARFGRQQVDVHLDQITGVHQQGKIRFVQITIETRNRKHRLLVPKAEAFRFMGALAPLVRRHDVTTDPGVMIFPGAPRLAGLLARVTAPPEPYVKPGELARVEASIERLENEVERLQQHVEFLEKLLQKRSEGAYSIPGPARDG
jgi:hypothetical protein